MFITRAIERGVDVKVIAEWQGHKAGGRLILNTYSHVRPVHSQRMAQIMTTAEPQNAVRMPKTKGATRRRNSQSSRPECEWNRIFFSLTIQTLLTKLPTTLV